MAEANVLFLYGNDEFAISRRLEALQEKWDKGRMNTVHLDAHTASKDALNTAVNSMPFLGEKRLVFIANPFACSSDAKERGKFIRFLQAAPESTLVVMHEVIEKRDIDKHWVVKRAVTGEFKWEAFMLPGLKAIPGWIINEAKRQEGSIEPAAAAKLADMVGEDTRTAAQEISKLLAYVDHARPISTADVEAVSINTAQSSIFELVDAMAAGRGKDAQSMLRRMLEDEDVMALWGMVIRQFRLLLLAREVIEAHGSVLDAQTNIHEAAYSVQKAYEQAKRFTMPALEKIYHHLLEMDEGAKTSQVPLDLALEMLVVELGQN